MNISRLDACPRCGTLKPHWQELCRSCLRAARELTREEIHRALLENQQRLREERHGEGLSGTSGNRVSVSRKQP